MPLSWCSSFRENSTGITGNKEHHLPQKLLIIEQIFKTLVHDIHIMSFNRQANTLNDLDRKPVQDEHIYVLADFFFYRIKHEFASALPYNFFLSFLSKDNMVQRFWGNTAHISCSPRGTNTPWHITLNQGSRSGVSGVLLTSKVARSHALCNLIILNVWTPVWVMPHRSGSHWWQQYISDLHSCL